MFDSFWSPSSSEFYHTLGGAMRRRFGCNVWKVSIDAGFSCPHVSRGEVGKDLVLNRGGCIFCNMSSFSPGRNLVSGKSICEQIDEGIIRLKRHYPKVDKFIAYFQPSTNTNAPPERLKLLYREAIVHPDVVGLSIGTRPDCLSEGVLDVLEEVGQEKYLQLEIGLQSVHQKSLDFLNRGYDYVEFLESYGRVCGRGIDVCLHLIIGTPVEGRDDVIETAREVARLKPSGLKLHNLHVVRDTVLADLWRSGGVELLTVEEYSGLVVDFLECIPPEVVVERVSAEVNSDFAIAPDWVKIKHAARNEIQKTFKKRNSHQGKYYTPPPQ
ncbi:MAG: TIGR01212 family radical SAM protein [Planctomycetaceae bacterium]|jgi:radical SAM protein (TIGR01212 family)|nr:TIGR01212 family radical SAM protein [Planctomycetaceae bacterium]